MCTVPVDQEFLNDTNHWTRVYDPQDVELCYDRPQDVLIKPPTRVIVRNDSGEPVTCFFNRFDTSFGYRRAKEELATHKKISMAGIPPPPEALVCHLQGVV